MKRHYPLGIALLLPFLTLAGNASALEGLIQGVDQGVQINPPPPPPPEDEIPFERTDIVVGACVFVTDFSTMDENGFPLGYCNFTRVDHWNDGTSEIHQDFTTDNYTQADCQEWCDAQCDRSNTTAFWENMEPDPCPTAHMQITPPEPSNEI